MTEESTLSNQPGVFIGFFKGRWTFLSMKQGGPVQGLPSLEHALLAARASDETRDEAIRPRLTSRIRMRYKEGRCVERADWVQIRDQILWALVLEKFGVNMQPIPHDKLELQEMLIETHPAYIEDGNVSCDNWAGNCRCPKCNRQKGQNMHGRFLMVLRTQLLKGHLT